MQITLEEALVRAKEIGEGLGGRDQRCLELLIRAARRGRRISERTVNAVGLAVQGTQHFIRAREEIDKGLEAIGDTTRTLVGSEQEPHEEED
jgi:hypothetical protein